MKHKTKTIRLYDNTRLSAYKNCPRFYYFRHVRHWRPDGSEWALLFGASWHAAMDYIWSAFLGEHPHRGTVEEISRGAFAAWVEKWVAEGGPDPKEMDYALIEELSPRTPGNAWEMIVAYVHDRQQQLRTFKLVEVEKAFAVPLDSTEPLFYIGKIDKLVIRDGRYVGLEHKTSTAYKKNGPFRSGFIDSFSPNAQVDGYLYALHMLYPGKVGGVWVDGALVHKSEQGFMFIPVEKQLAMLDAWLWETRDWIREVEDDLERLNTTQDTDKVMTAFRKNTNSCWNFNRQCPYMDCCKAWPNPKGKPMPSGMKEDKWDPLKHLGPIEGLT